MLVWWSIWWYAAITFQDNLIGAQAITNNYTPINFIAPGNDFAGGIIWLTNKKLETSVTITDNESQISCESQIRGLYFNSQRGERLWPLDAETAADFGWTGSDVGLEIDGGRYTDCSSQGGSLDNGFIEYSVFGTISYDYEGINYALVAGAAMDYNANTLGSLWINGLQYINNQTPVWYIYDSAGGIGFVWGRVNNSNSDPRSDIDNDIRTQHAALLSDLSTKTTTINRAVYQWWGSNFSLFGQNIEWYDATAALNTKLWFAVLGNIGMGRGYTETIKRSILGNPWAQSNISEVSSVNAANRINQAKKNAARLCRWVTEEWLWGRVHYSDEVICVAEDTEIIIRANGDTIAVDSYPPQTQTISINGRTIVTTSDIAIDESHSPASEPLEIYVDGHVRIVADADDRVDITAEGFPTITNTDVTQWLFYKMTLIANGLLMGPSNTSIDHKLYLHGKIATLNTASDARDTRNQQVGSNESQPLLVSLSKLFSRRCNPSTGKGPDDAVCNAPNDEFALIPLVVIDQQYPSRLLQQ